MLDRQEESGQGVSFGTMETNFRGKVHECNPNHRFGLHSVNWTQKLDCIRLIERTNSICGPGITGVHYGGISGRFRGSCWTAKRSRARVSHLGRWNPIFAANYTNVIKIIVLDCIQLIGRKNWIAFG